MKEIKTMTLSAVVALTALFPLNSNASVSESIKSKVSKYVGQDSEVVYFNSESGLVGIGVTNKTGQKRVFYSTPDGKYLLAGAMVKTETGENITAGEIEQYAPEPNWDGLIGALNDSHFIETGNPESKNEIYVFVDPNCGYCHKTYQMLKDHEKVGDVSVKWIPVGVLGMTSANNSQSLLGADQDMQIKSLDTMMGKLPYRADSELIAKGSQKYAQNMNIFKAHGFGGVPVVITNYQSGVEVIQGMPSISKIKAGL